MPLVTFPLFYIHDLNLDVIELENTRNMKKKGPILNSDNFRKEWNISEYL